MESVLGLEVICTYAMTESMPIVQSKAGRAAAEASQRFSGPDCRDEGSSTMST